MTAPKCAICAERVAVAELEEMKLCQSCNDEFLSWRRPVVRIEPIDIDETVSE